MKIEGSLFGKPWNTKERQREVLKPITEIRRKRLTVGFNL